MSPKYTHLLFDLDHTLWDFETNSRHVIHTLFNQFDIGQKADIAFPDFFSSFSVINETLWAKYRNGLLRQDEIRWKRFWSTLLEYKIADEALARSMSARYLELLPVQSVLMPHTRDVLDYCKRQQYKMHIITNGFEDTQLRKMEHSGIAHYFSEVITSERCMSLKPHKEIFDFTLDVIHAAPEDCLMIGDNYEVDVVGAINADIDQVWYTSASRSVERPASYQISDLKELTEII